MRVSTYRFIVEERDHAVLDRQVPIFGAQPRQRRRRERRCTDLDRSQLDGRRIGVPGRVEPRLVPRQSRAGADPDATGDVLDERIAIRLVAGKPMSDRQLSKAGAVAHERAVVGTEPEFACGRFHQPIDRARHRLAPELAGNQAIVDHRHQTTAGPDPDCAVVVLENGVEQVGLAFRRCDEPGSSIRFDHH
ncbi:MAG: hypothetical protein AAGE01_01550, partial [Pseudomonadota bacterium]